MSDVDVKAVEWLRGQVQARLEAAKRAGTGEPWEAEQHYDALWTVDLKPGAGQVASVEEAREASLGIEGCEPYEDPRFLAAMAWHAGHVALNDPPDVIARCEAELAILDEHGPSRRDASRCRVCTAIANDGATRFRAPCPTVRSLASGYRHRPGYAEHWGDR